MNNLFDNLNEQQKIAALQKDGPVLILAGAGSGKTRVLTIRIAHLIEQNVRPWNILAITFTNKAAREMRERVNAIVGTASSNIWVSTFHSTCVRLLRMEISKIGYDSNFVIYDADDSERLIKECIKMLNIDEKKCPAKSVMYTINSLKDELITPQEYGAESVYDIKTRHIFDLYTLYQKRLKQNNALDFNDLIMKTVLLFQNNPEVLDKYQEKFKYILVDEYQDTNMAQYVLVTLLAEKYKNLCVVGDDDQSIYSWRGADISNILNFSKDFPGALVVKLEQNYRSTKTILSSANAVIHNNVERARKTLWTDNSIGNKINLFNAYDEQSEAEFIVDTIMENVTGGAKYNDFAVLYRTNAQSRVIEERLVRFSIPYRLLGGLRFYARAEIKDLISYLNVINNPLDDISLRRIINVPRRGIGNTTIQRIAEYANDNSLSFFEALNNYKNIETLSGRKKLQDFITMLNDFIEASKRFNVNELLDVVINNTKYIELLKAEGTEIAEGKIQNINELINVTYKAGDLSLSEFLEEVALVADIDNYRENEDAVVLMTLHSSKGLEFPYVFISGMEDGIFPSSQSIYSSDLSKLEEERRLCYVGMTRAKTTLYLIHAKTRMIRGDVNYNKPSRFIDEIPSDNINVIKSSLKPKGKTGSRGNKSTDKFSSGFSNGNSSKFAAISKTKSSVTLQNTPLKRQIERPTLYHSKLPQLLEPSNITLDFEVGNRVRQQRYGIGSITDIKAAGADYEITIAFDKSGIKKFMSSLVKLSIVKE